MKTRRAERKRGAPHHWLITVQAQEMQKSARELFYVAKILQKYLIYAERLVVDPILRLYRKTTFQPEVNLKGGEAAGDESLR